MDWLFIEGGEGVIPWLDGGYQRVTVSSRVTAAK